MLFILFQLGSDRYALPASGVAEVLPLVALKTIPGAPRGVAGLMNYRGTPVPVIDLAALALGRPAERRVSTRLLMARYPMRDGSERALGLIAEHATELASKAAADFQHAGVRTEATRFLGPVANDARGLIQRIELDALLTDELRAALFPETNSTPPPHSAAL